MMKKNNTNLCPPVRGFSTSEYERRLEKIQALMLETKIDVILLTSKVDIGYYTGFDSQFFESPTRPWFVLLPLTGKPIAIVPEIGGSGMKSAWVERVETWPSPSPGNEEVSLLVSEINLLTRRFHTLGIPKGKETTLRMPLNHYHLLIESLSRINIRDATALLQKMRYVKSCDEIKKIQHICTIASIGFENLPKIFVEGKSERDLCQSFKKLLLDLGADNIPYMVSGSGHGGYDSVIMGPSQRIINPGDIFMIDTGSVYDNYFCDFDRNFAFEYASDEVKYVYRLLYKATEAGFSVCTAGNTTTDIFNAMNNVLVDGGMVGGSVGRFGHGIGLQLTEWPSNTPFSEGRATLEKGVVITLEPSAFLPSGKEMVHEENVLITEDKPIWLSKRAPEELPIV